MTNLSSHWIMLSLPTTGVWRGVLGGSWSVGGQIARERGGRMPKARKPVHRDFLEIFVQQHHGLSPTQITCFVIFIFLTTTALILILLSLISYPKLSFFVKNYKKWPILVEKMIHKLVFLGWFNAFLKEKIQKMVNFCQKLAFFLSFLFNSIIFFLF